MVQERWREAALGRQRPSIALVVDDERWAFANIARQVIRHLSDSYEFRLLPGNVVGNIVKLLIMSADADLRHFFWRVSLMDLWSPFGQSYLARLGYSHDAFEDRFLSGRRTTTAVYDHLMLSEAEVADKRGFFTWPLLNGYSVSSRRLYEIYVSLPGYPLPTAVLEDGVDLELFRPMDADRFLARPDHTLVVGWVGNSTWGPGDEDFKGVRTIIMPALDIVRSRGIQVTECFADRRRGFIPHSEMPGYYAQVDVVVCASQMEGTPNPVLEAMACGVPVITTDVGVVPQALGPLQQAFVLRERTAEALAERLIELARHPSLSRELSRENLDHIRAWSWHHKVGRFRPFFDHALGS